MEPDNSKSNPDDKPLNTANQAPPDALSMTPDEISQQQSESAADNPSNTPLDKSKKTSKVRRFFRRINVYFLLFLLVLVIAGAITVVNYLNSQKTEPEASIEAQSLSDEALQQLANKDATVGNTSQTLTIQGNAVIAGQTLMRGNLNVAGNFQTGGTIRGTSITTSGAANFGTAQVNSLQVASNTAIQGDTTLRNLNVSGSSSFNGAMRASEITTTRLILSGDGALQVPNHISFSGPSPGRSITAGVLGSGGSASVNGSDTTGTVNINTGNNTSAGCFVRISFNRNFSTRPHVIISPVGAAAGRTQYYTNRDASGFSICTSSPAPANQAFAFDYFVTG